MAELLVRAEDHWMDSLTSEQVEAMDDRRKENYEARFQKGDVVCVKPDGHQWGKKEGLPKFIVVKVPNMTVEEAAVYLEEDTDIDDSDTERGDRHVVTRMRKRKLPVTEVERIKSLPEGREELQESKKTEFLSKIETKPRVRAIKRVRTLRNG